MSGMKGDRLWLAGGAVAGVVISALAWFMVVSPELSNASSLDEQTVASQTQNVSLQSKIHRLQADNSNMDALVASLHQARTALPVTTGLAEFTRQLSAYATEYGVVISGITAGDPAALTSATPAPAAAEAAAAAPAAGSASKTPPAAGAAKASPAGQLYALPLTVVVKGSAVNDLRFLAAVQGPGRRAALVSGTQLTGDTSKRGMQLTIQMQVFVAPQAPGAVDKLIQRLANTK
jgi:pyruvate/2-oxoglutarate dehydrogenase complex dihydrolipoamide acyltransferase (E2) component